MGWDYGEKKIDFKVKDRAETVGKMTDLQEFSTDNNQTLDVRDKIQERLEQELADLVPCILLELKGLQESIVENDLLWYFHENDVEEDKVDITVDRFVRLFKDKLKFYVETKKKSNKTIEDYKAEKENLLDIAYNEFLTYSFSDDEGWTIDREDGVMLRKNFDGTYGEIVGIFHNEYGDVKYEYINIDDLEQ